MDPVGLYGFEVGLWESVGILIGMFVFCRFVAYLFLHFLREKL